MVNLSLFLTVVQSEAAHETPDMSTQPGLRKQRAGSSLAPPAQRSHPGSEQPLQGAATPGVFLRCNKHMYDQSLAVFPGCTKICQIMS